MNYDSLAQRYFASVDANERTDNYLCDFVQYHWENDLPTELFTADELWFLRDYFIKLYA